MKRLHWLRLLFALFLGTTILARSEVPFQQAISHKYPLPSELRGSARKLAIDQDGIVYVQTSKGVARLFDDHIALDGSFRPIAGKVATEINVQNGELFSLFPDELLSNRRAGKFVYKTPTRYDHFAVNRSGVALFSKGPQVTLLKDGKFSELPDVAGRPFEEILAAGEFFVGRAGEDVYRIREKVQKIRHIPGLKSLTAEDLKLYAGTQNGLLVFNAEEGEPFLPVLERVPSTNITSLATQNGEIWAGTTRGAWKMTGHTSFRYFASKRWLQEEEVLDIKIAPGGNVFVLTSSAVNEIEFRWMTLGEKAAWYENKIRQRHIRYGFCSELHLRVAGDVTSAEMIDSDNDGTWSNYYMASQAFRFGATGDAQARRNAWETFEALERLESINPLGGFPSRTFERVGFKLSDPDRWHAVGDGLWDWKAHTSSDEIIAHMFGSAVLYETCATTAAEKERVARFVGKILDHIISHNWYLIDVDGKPTLWGRWNPEYVNGFPETMFDRRLNSAEIIAALQFGYAITQRESYKDKAFELMDKHGYLRNILLPMSGVNYTPGFKHQDVEMGMDWNHSDDLLGFVTYWVLNRFAFNNDLRAQYSKAVQDHWNLEKSERCPLWNFVYAATGATEFDLEGALWTLRYFPLDMIDWSVSNSQRRDITPLAPNFRFQELEELLPPDERRITRWNAQPFILNGGTGGSSELAGDEYLLPYWMGRYLKLIQ